MPRIKRWFPVSHDINSDPEVWAMRHEIGEKALSIWLEFLSIADRNEGEIPGDLEDLIRSIAGRCQSTVRTVTGVYQVAISRLWLMYDPTLRVTNYWKYHRTRGTNLVPSEPSEPSEPDSYQNKNPISPSADFKNERKREGDFGMSRSMNLEPELKAAADKVYMSDPVKFKRIAAWIGQGRKHNYPESEMAEALTQFFEYRFIDDWFPYLDEILDKIHKDRGIRESNREHQRQIDELKAASKASPALALVRGLAEAKGMK